MGTLASLVLALAAMYPDDVDVSDELVEAIAFIEPAYTAEELVRAGYVAGVLAFFLPLPLVYTPVPLVAVLVICVVVSFLVMHGVHTAPHLLASLRRTRALGETPDLIGRAVLRMHIQPATENAVRFAAETGDGPLAASLESHIDRSIGTPDSGLISFAEDWSEDFPALQRSSHLLSAAQEAPDGERDRTLDRAMAAVLNGTREQMAEFTAAIRSPTTALYAFGVMLPLALVALVPAASLAGYPVSIWFFVVVYNVVLPVMLIAASVWLLVRRPVAFPPPDVKRSHPDVPDRTWPPFVYGALAGVCGAAVAIIVGSRHLAPLAGIGLGVGFTLVGYFRPIKEVREYVKDVEEHLVDALYIVGRQVSDNEAVESAIDHAGHRVPGETGDVFDDAAGIQKRLKTTVEEAFLGQYGALKDIPSVRTEGTAALLAIAADEGQPAGKSIVSMADHLEELREVERRTKRKLAMVTGTLTNTASFFGPLVGGATVGLASGMVGSGADVVEGGSALPTDQLGIVIGVYIITLAVILTTLSMALRHGLDRSVIGYRVGRALIFAVPIYLIATVAVGVIAGTDAPV
ncbi:secretion system protein [Haloarcula salinisoli]|uniref:Secretion system protein n=1 Tax=Haloarcula salinisoli TaxID=2487746 RepID=A0A8J7YHL1_9EURY|nr:secretion system protein [Halomicroarcula salinisoli]MBX0285041.1 secretion system protein [Halomicroarcula salinisoli]MBX0303481.1 secretion system protein [Halomicroarcula salinisoli]